MQVSPKFRRLEGNRLSWYCPACKEMHVLPLDQGWKFNGDLIRPTFTPSFRHTFTKGHGCLQITEICHYTMTEGKVFYYTDCTHHTRGEVIMPDLPEEWRD